MPKNKSSAGDFPEGRENGFLRRFASGMRQKLKSGFFGSVIASLDGVHSDSLADMSGRYASGGRAFARLVENSVIYRFFSRLADKLLKKRLKVYGVFLLTFGVYTAVINAVLAFFAGEERSFFQLFCGICAAVVSFPLIFSVETLSSSLCNSEFGKWIVTVAGIRHESVRRSGADGRSGGAFIFGAVSGILAYFFTPLTVIVWVVKIVFVCIAFVSPEFGLLAILLLFPFVSPSTVVFISVFSIVSFLFKLLRGKRYLCFTSADIAVMLFGLMILVFSAFYGKAVFTGGIHFFAAVLGYFLSVIVLKSRKWFYRAVSAFLVSSSAVASCILIDWSLNSFGIYGSITKMLSAESSVIYSGAAYFSPCFVLCAPIAVGMCIDPCENVNKRISVFATALSVIAIIVTDQLQMIPAAAVGIIAVLVISSGKNKYAFVSAGLLFAAGALWEPQLIRIICFISEKTGEFFDHLKISDVYMNSLSGGSSFESGFISRISPFPQIMISIILLVLVFMTAVFCQRTEHAPDRILSGMYKGKNEASLEHDMNYLSRRQVLTSLKTVPASLILGAAAFMFLCRGSLLWSGGTINFVMWMMLGVSASYISAMTDELSLDRPFGPVRVDKTTSSFELIRISSESHERNTPYGK